MNTVKRVSSLRASVKSAKLDGKTVAFVPTMGNLHEGHLDLVRRAHQEADFVVVSIYVNPTQFGENEDLSSYPRTEQEDARLLVDLEVDLLFLPDDNAMYPGDISVHTRVDIPKITERYCGEFRPGHFRGVATVVARLFNIVQPDVAIFGQKDYQQLFVIKKLVNDLAFPVEIVGSKTTREESGLAMSSRNGYLTKDDKQVAPEIYRSLENIVEAIAAGNTNFKKLTKEAKEALESHGFDPQYIEVCRQSDLLPATSDDKELVVLIAANLGGTRLIDNLEVSVN